MKKKNYQFKLNGMLINVRTAGIILTTADTAYSWHLCRKHVNVGVP
jgi:hypothetical protein